jgi:hypothetical protein
LTIPAIGTGFAAAFGFGMSMGDSLRGFAEGFKRFVDSLDSLDERGTTLRNVDYNVYAKPSDENAAQIDDLCTKAGLPDTLK